MDISYRHRIINLYLIPLSYWFEYLGLFFFIFKNGLFVLAQIPKVCVAEYASRLMKLLLDYTPNVDLWGFSSRVILLKP